MIKYLPLLALAACAPVQLEAIKSSGLHDSQIAIAVSRTIPTVEQCKNQPYVYDLDENDEWKPVERFLAEGGDCEDFAVCYYKALEAEGKEPKIVIMEDHAFTMADGFRYDQQSIKAYDLHSALYVVDLNNVWRVK